MGWRKNSAAEKRGGDKLSNLIGVATRRSKLALARLASNVANTINVITWDETKRLRNIRDRDGIDLAECESIFDWPMVTTEDAREAYGEKRLESYGLLNGRVVVLIWTDCATGTHLISCRYGEKHEIREYFKNAAC